MKITIITILLLFITINSYAVIPIYCPECREHLYDYQKDEIIPNTVVLANDFKPANENIPQLRECDGMICSLCRAPLNWYEYQAYRDNQPMPIFYCWAISLLTRDDTGFHYIPYDVEKVK